MRSGRVSSRSSGSSGHASSAPAGASPMSSSSPSSLRRPVNRAAGSSALSRRPRVDAQWRQRGQQIVVQVRRQRVHARAGSRRPLPPCRQGPHAQHRAAQPEAFGQRFARIVFGRTRAAPAQPLHGRRKEVDAERRAHLRPPALPRRHLRVGPTPAALAAPAPGRATAGRRSRTAALPCAQKPVICPWQHSRPARSATPGPLASAENSEIVRSTRIMMRSTSSIGREG